MGDMDNTTAQPVTWLKIEFNGGVIRTRPFEARHLTALKMAQALKSGSRKADIMLSALAALLGEETYSEVIGAIMDGEVDFRDAVSGLLTSIVEATEAYTKAQRAAEEEPLPREALDA